MSWRAMPGNEVTVYLWYHLQLTLAWRGLKSVPRWNLWSTLTERLQWLSSRYTNNRRSSYDRCRPCEVLIDTRVLLATFGKQLNSATMRGSSWVITCLDHLTWVGGGARKGYSARGLGTQVLWFLEAEHASAIVLGGSWARKCYNACGRNSWAEALYFQFMHLSLHAEWIGCRLVWPHKTRCWPPPPGIVQTFLTRWGQKGLHGDQSTPCKDTDALESWSLQRFATKICTKSWNMNYQYYLDKLHLQTVWEEVSLSCVTCTNRFMVCPLIFPNSPTTTSSPSHPTHSNHNPSYVYPPPTQTILLLLWYHTYLELITLLCYAITYP